MQFSGSAIIVEGEHVNVDSAMGWYLGMDGLPKEEIASKFLSGYDPAIAASAQKDDILVCGRNFGFGKIHNAFWVALNYIGISCIVAESFSTPMVQAAIKNGKYLVECPNVLQFVRPSEKISVNVETAEIIKVDTGEQLQGKPFPPFLQEVMQAGGQLGYLKKRIQQQKDANI